LAFGLHYFHYYYFKSGKAVLLTEDSAAGTTGDKNIYQNFFVCLNYEKRKSAESEIVGLYLQYGIQISSDETIHLYLSYFDAAPMEPIYYSFGTRNADVQILNAHLENFIVDEQIKLRCLPASSFSKASASATCDYKCHKACDGCTSSYLMSACKKCAYASIYLNASMKNTNDSIKEFLCVEKCPNGHKPNLTATNKICIGIFLIIKSIILFNFVRRALKMLTKENALLQRY
jgi:hypothetical protein